MSVSFDTEYSACSLEFHPSIPSLFAVGLYQVVDEAGESYTRKGRILLLENTGSSIELVQSIDCDAVLDLKWDSNFLFAATSTGFLLHYALEIDPTPKLVIVKSSSLCSSLCLALDLDSSNILTSFSNGSIQLIDRESDTSISKIDAHLNEVWSCAISKSNPNIFYSGSDDMIWKHWDKRTNQLLLGNTSHEAGVTVISCHPSDMNLIATGSYDEYIRIWDVRMIKKKAGGII